MTNPNGFTELFNELMDVHNGKSDMEYDEILRTFQLSDYITIPLNVDFDFGVGCSSSDQALYFSLETKSTQACIYIFKPEFAPSTKDFFESQGIIFEHDYAIYIDSYEFEGMINGEPVAISEIQQTDSLDVIRELTRQTIEQTATKISL